MALMAGASGSPAPSRVHSPSPSALRYNPEFTRDKFAILAARLDKEIGTTDPVYQQICRDAGEAVGNLTLDDYGPFNLLAAYGGHVSALSEGFYEDV